MSDKKNMKLFSLNSNPEIAQKIADHAGVPLGKISSRQFSDGEIQVNIEESVRGYDIYIIQSTSFPVNNHLMELLIMVDACQRASANTVNVVMPYFGYARQDRTAAPREPITAKLSRKHVGQSWGGSCRHTGSPCSAGPRFLRYRRR